MEAREEETEREREKERDVWRADRELFTEFYASTLWWGNRARDDSIREIMLCFNRYRCVRVASMQLSDGARLLGEQLMMSWFGRLMRFGFVYK